MNPDPFSAETCARFVLRNLGLRHGPQWLSGPRCGPQRLSGPRQKLPGRARTENASPLVDQLRELGLPLTPKHLRSCQELNSLSDLCAGYFFRGVVLDSHEGLVGW